VLGGRGDLFQARARTATQRTEANTRASSQRAHPSVHKPTPPPRHVCLSLSLASPSAHKEVGTPAALLVLNSVADRRVCVMAGSDRLVVRSRRARSPPSRTHRQERSTVSTPTHSSQNRCRGYTDADRPVVCACRHLVRGRLSSEKDEPAKRQADPPALAYTHPPLRATTGTTRSVMITQTL
jgi:hypothetical protein